MYAHILTLSLLHFGSLIIEPDIESSIQIV